MRHVLSMLLLLLLCVQHASGRAVLQPENCVRESFAIQYWSEGASSPDFTGENWPLGYDLASDVCDGPNLYAYVKQNPWTKFDPLGLCDGGFFYGDDHFSRSPEEQKASIAAYGAVNRGMWVNGPKNLYNALNTRAHVIDAFKSIGKAWDHPDGFISGLSEDSANRRAAAAKEIKRLFTTPEGSGELMFTALTAALIPGPKGAKATASEGKAMTTITHRGTAESIAAKVEQGSLPANLPTPNNAVTRLLDHSNPAVWVSEGQPTLLNRLLSGMVGKRGEASVTFDVPSASVMRPDGLLKRWFGPAQRVIESDVPIPADAKVKIPPTIAKPEL